MKCPACQHDNRAGAKFCEECAAPVKRLCAGCGIELRPAAKFCDACGAPAQATTAGGGSDSVASPNRAPSSAARKVVTILFADLAGSTALQERLDPESARGFMERYYRAMTAAVDAHGGTVVKLLGDGVMAVFGVPTVAEDDAIRAVRAAMEMVEVLGLGVGGLGGGDSTSGPTPNPITPNPLSVRIAVNTGEVVVSSDDSDVVGDPVNVAARLQQEAGSGEVVIGASTQRLVAPLVTLAPLGSFALKGRSETVQAYRVVSLERPATATATAFVGREADLARLTRVYDAAVAAPAARLAVLLGSPGLGKSRLIDELGRRLGAAATVIAAQCDAGGGGTFAPIAAALRQHLALDAAAGAEIVRGAIESVLPAEDADRVRIAGGVAALLAGSPASPEETFFAVRRVLGGIAATRPLLLVIDDLHWAEPLLLDLIEHLVQWGSGVPLLVLVGARPELRDVRASLAVPGPLVSEVVTLAGLDAGAATRLAANVIGAADLPAAVAGKLLATSEGNPLFVAELVRMLVEEGALARDGERWVGGANLAALEMPPTIHALLAARIERLRPDERAVLERAAVVGRHFSRNAVAALLPGEAGALDACLESLKRSELIESDGGWLLGEPVLRFHHVLIRDAAYRRLLKGTRAELHGRFADWVEARAGAAVEHDETIGRHLEQAHLHLSELGPLDAHGRRFGERAAQRLAAAGRRALAGDDLPLAAGLLGRAIQCLDADDASRADLALDWCEALLAAGDVGPAAGAIGELARFASGEGVRGWGLGVGGGEERNEEVASDASRGAMPTSASPAANALLSDPNPKPLTPNPLSSGSRPATPNPRLRAWHTCFTGQLTVLTAPQALQATADAVAAAATQFAALGDAAGEAKAHQVHAQALARLGRVGACEAALDKALAAARKAGDRRRANAVLAGAPLAALWGPSPVTRASGRCLDVVRVLRITQGAPAVEAVALSCQGVLEALRGRTDAARRMISASRKMVEELGITHRLLEADAFVGRIDLLEGDAVAAERSLRAAYEGLRALGLGIDAAQAAALLARALLAQGRAAEADALSRDSEALAGDDLQAAIAWRGVRAEALAQRGEHAAAIELARAAVTIAAATDALLDHADARQALATALRAAGRGAESAAEERRAIELWEAKGATLLAERARNGRAPVAPVGVAAAAPIAAPPAARRRVRANAASLCLERFDAAVTARDLDALGRMLAEDLEEISHATGKTHGRREYLHTYRSFFRAARLAHRSELLATLGDALGLCRIAFSFDGLADADLESVGVVEAEMVFLIEAGPDGSCRRLEQWSCDHLGDAVARLYARDAELLPEGAERQRATATARAVAYTLTDSTTPDETLLFDPQYEDIDHRNVGYGTLSTEEAQKLVVSQRALAADLRFRVEDILALCRDGLVRKSTTSGVWRDGGGAFERSVCMLSVFGSDGRATRQETFDSDRDAEALARFDALTSGASPARPERDARPAAPVDRRVRENAATALSLRFGQAVAIRDADALAELLSERLEFVHHQTAATYGRRETLTTWRSLFRAERLTWRAQLLGALGDSLALDRHVTSAAGFAEAHLSSVGVMELEEVGVWEVDGQGRGLRLEVFAADHLGDAVARLYQRHAERLPDGPARQRATATAAAIAVMVAPPDLDRYAAALAPAVEFKDHRTVGFASGRGATTLLRGFRSLLELATEVATRVDDVLRLEPGAMLLRWTTSGTDRRSGGAFESSFLLLWTFGPDGRIARDETFDVGRDAEALARFDDLTRGASEVREPDCETEALARFDALVGAAAAPRASPFANAASRSLDREMQYWAARNWEGLQSLVAPTIRFHDRRRLLHVEVGIEQFTAQQRMLFDQPRSRWIEPMIATRGERLSLHRVVFEAEVAGGGGPLEIEDHLVVVEVDAAGRWTALVLFDLADEAAARGELERRFAAGEGVACLADTAIMRAFAAAVASGDWAPVVALCAPTFVEYDHRGLAVLGTTRGGAAWAQNLRTLTDLAPDTVCRVDHFRCAARGFCAVGTWHGTRAGGRYAIALIAVIEVDAGGRMRRADIYDEQQSDRALARFAELAVDAAAPPPFANAATASAEAVIGCMLAHDWQGFARLFAADFHMSDRRRVVQLELDRDQYVAFTREVADGRAIRNRWELVATRGDRLAVTRSVYEFADADVGPSEIAFLLLMEIDARGRIVANVRWDVDDLDAAYAEIEARWRTGEAAIHPRAAQFVADYQRHFAARDWTAMTALMAPELVAESHRLVGWGTLHGAAALVSTMRTQIELASDTQVRMDHIRTCAGGALFAYAWDGTHDGGDFENLYIVAAELDATGRASRVDVWEPEQIDAAEVRFAALSTSATAAPLASLAAGSGALAALEHYWALFDAGPEADWAALRDRCSAQMIFEDRQGFARLAGDRELMIASLRERAASGARAERRLIGTAGERVALVRMLWSGGPSDGRFEIEYLSVVEVDAAGLVAAIILFAADDARGAQREAWARWAAVDPAAGPVTALYGAVLDAANEHDATRYRALFAADLVIEDHRHGLRIDGLDAYAEQVALLWQQAPDSRLDGGWLWPASARHGAVTVTRRVGALADEFLWLFTVQRGEIARIEVFGLDALDAAVARLAELRPDPLRIPPNAAVRASDRHWALADAGDWDGVRALHAPGLLFDDRRRGLRTSADGEAYLTGLRWSAPGTQAVRTLLATAGERLALWHNRFSRTQGEVVLFEVETLAINEIDAEGRLVAVVLFDPDERAAASAELFERYVARGADAAPPVGLEVARAWNAHDSERLRALLPDDFYLDDRRRTGVGRVEGADAYCTSLAAMWELSRDLRTDMLYTAAIAPHGRLYVARWSGTNAEGGEFDAVYVCLGLMRGDRPIGLEIFELEDFDAARARFESLRGAAPGERRS